MTRGTKLNDVTAWTHRHDFALERVVNERLEDGNAACEHDDLLQTHVRDVHLERRQLTANDHPAIATMPSQHVSTPHQCDDVLGLLGVARVELVDVDVEVDGVDDVQLGFVLRQSGSLPVFARRRVQDLHRTQRHHELIVSELVQLVTTLLILQDKQATSR